MSALDREALASLLCDWTESFVHTPIEVADAIIRGDTELPPVDRKPTLGAVVAPQSRETDSGLTAEQKAIRYLRSKLGTVALLSSCLGDAKDAAREGLSITEQEWSWLDHPLAEAIFREPIQ